MKILFISNFFPPYKNAGAEQVAYQLSKAFKNMGHELTVITTRPDLPNGQIETTNYEGLNIYTVGSNYHNRWVAYRSLYNPFVLRSIKKILKSKEHFDIAHLHNIHHHISYGVIPLLKNFGVKMVMTAHDAMMVEHGKFTQGIYANDLSLTPKVDLKISARKSFKIHRLRYNPFRNRAIKFFLKDLSKIVTVSDMQQELLAANGITNMLTIHNGVRTDTIITQKHIELFRKKYAISKKDKILMFAGRISKYKGSEEVEKMLLSAIGDDNNIKLLIAGIDKNPFSDERLKHHVITTGWLSADEMHTAYNIADMALVPSICYEMFGNVVLEALNEGTPVIVSSFTGAQEVLTDEMMGTVVNPFDTRKFAEVVLEYLNHKSKNINDIERLKQYVKINFDIEKIAIQYIKLFESVR